MIGFMRVSLLVFDTDSYLSFYHTDDWVHRIGRSGRAGKKGKAITFFTGFGHEKALAGEFMRVLRDAGAEIPEAMNQFPSTIKKKEHG